MEVSTGTADLEERVLGALLDAEGATGSNAAALLELSGLKPEDFTIARVRAAWVIASRLIARGRPVDSLSLYAAGKATNDFSSSDGDWLLKLQTSNAATRETFASVAEEIRGESRRRSLLWELKRHVQQLEAGAVRAVDVASALDPVLSGLTGGEIQTGTGSDDVLELSESWEAQEQGRTKPLLVPTGIPAIDEVIGGYPPNLSIVCGLPSVGKSAKLATLIDRHLIGGLRVGLVGLEDGSSWCAKRLMARDLGIAVRQVGTLRRDAALSERFSVVAPALSKHLANLYTFRQTKEEAAINTGALLRLCTHWFLNLDVDVIYVDHGGEVEHEGPTPDADFRLRVAETYRRLRNLAVRVKRPIVVLAHTVRPGDENEERPPRPSELAESAYIERRARLIFGLWSRASEPDVMRSTIIKNTEGPKGVTFKIPRLSQCALLDPENVEQVNLQQEKREEAKAARERRELEKLEIAALRAKAKEEQKAAAAKAKNPQLELAGSSAKEG